MSRINEALWSTQLSLLWICALAAALVFIALVYSTATHRPVASAQGSRRRNVLREVVWAAVPIFIVVAAALPAMTASFPAQGDKSLVTENRVACEAPDAEAPKHLLAASPISHCAKQR